MTTTAHATVQHEDWTALETPRASFADTSVFRHLGTVSPGTAAGETANPKARARNTAALARRPGTEGRAAAQRRSATQRLPSTTGSLRRA